MAKHRTHRTHSIAFKRQVVQEYLAGETLHGLARRHDLSRTLIRIWVDKYEAVSFPAVPPAPGRLLPSHPVAWRPAISRFENPSNNAMRCLFFATPR